MHTFKCHDITSDLMSLVDAGMTSHAVRSHLTGLETGGPRGARINTDSPSQPGQQVFDLALFSSI